MWRCDAVDSARWNGSRLLHLRAKGDDNSRKPHKGIPRPLSNILLTDNCYDVVMSHYCSGIQVKSDSAPYDHHECPWEVEPPYPHPMGLLWQCTFLSCSTSNSRWALQIAAHRHGWACAPNKAQCDSKGVHGIHVGDNGIHAEQTLWRSSKNIRGLWHEMDCSREWFAAWVGWVCGCWHTGGWRHYFQARKRSYEVQEPRRGELNGGVTAIAKVGDAELQEGDGCVAKQTWWEEFNYTEFPLAASKVYASIGCVSF